MERKAREKYFDMQYDGEIYMEKSTRSLVAKGSDDSVFQALSSPQKCISTTLDIHSGSFWGLKRPKLSKKLAMTYQNKREIHFHLLFQYFIILFDEETVRDFLEATKYNVSVIANGSLFVLFHTDARILR